MSSAGGFPKWVMLEPDVFRRDANKSFPDVTAAPIRASGTTSWGANFRVAFSLAEPPQISCLYAQLPGFPGPKKEHPISILATHRQLCLLVVSSMLSSKGLLQDLFIFRANEKKPSSSSLTLLPLCTLPRGDCSLSHPTRHPAPPPRLLSTSSLGLWCSGDKEEEFVVAELELYLRTRGRSRIEARVDISLLRSSTTDVQLSHRKWEPHRVPILSTTEDDLWKLSQWQTDTIIPFQRWLCWVSYHHGILFCDVSNKDKVHVSFLWFPLDIDAVTKETACNLCYGGVSVVDHGRLLKFVNVERHDNLDYGALEPGTGFTITCHTLVIGGGGSMAWEKDYTVTSDDLPGYLQRQRGMPMFPQVDIERPHLVHFLFVEFESPCEKTSLLSIDMRAKCLVYFDLYMDGNELYRSLDPDFFTTKCMSLTSNPFLPCEFPRFCRLPRKRKHRD